MSLCVVSWGQKEWLPTPSSRWHPMDSNCTQPLPGAVPVTLTGRGRPISSPHSAFRRCAAVYSQHISLFNPPKSPREVRASALSLCRRKLRLGEVPGPPGSSRARFETRHRLPTPRSKNASPISRSSYRGGPDPPTSLQGSPPLSLLGLGPRSPLSVRLGLWLRVRVLRGLGLRTSPRPPRGWTGIRVGTEDRGFGLLGSTWSQPLPGD